MRTVYTLTMPKAGTGLLLKAISLIIKKEIHAGGWTTYDNTNLYFGHIHEQFLPIGLNPKITTIIIMRDPRDAIISQMHHILKFNDWHGGIFSPETLETFKNLSTEDKITFLITCPDSELGIPYYTRDMKHWMGLKHPHVHIFRFEDLIGPKGGGDRATQERNIQTLAEILTHRLRAEEISNICDQLFGGTGTFRDGQIGSWRSYFTEEHKALFKATLGNDLILMGYETDNEW